MRRLGVLLLYGGRSAEHEISCQSARHVAAAMDPGRYCVLAVGVTKQGGWVLPEVSEPVLAGGPLDVPAEAFAAEGRPVGLLADPARPRLVDLSGPPAELGIELEVVFPVLHGPYGEDGTIQGMLELADLPYVGAPVAASAVGMDKQKMKVAFEHAGIPMAGWTALRADVWRTDRAGALAHAGRLGFPCFVKPAGLGSSVGISRCAGPAALPRALELAFKYDRTAIVEEAIAGREIECGVLGNEQPEASVCGEIMPSGEFYDYKSKYIDSSSRTVIPADLPEPVSGLIQTYCLRAFKAIGAAGLSRVDFFFEQRGRGVLINEINTMPGFTTISMYPKLWEASGVGYSELIDRLIELAVQRHASRPRPDF